MIWPTDKVDLLELGAARLREFCDTNKLPTPDITVHDIDKWPITVCAYYRPKSGIHICLEKCQIPCGVAENRNWTWPTSTTDREPYGVILHELGHHADWIASDKKGTYYGDYSINLRAASGEKPITGYCDNDAEWFAEIFRLFAGNPGLLKALRPKTYALLLEKWQPVGSLDWRDCLGDNVPPRVIRTLTNKGAV